MTDRADDHLGLRHVRRATRTVIEADESANSLSDVMALGHTCYRDHYQEAVAAATRWPNLYLDVAGLGGPRVVHLVVESVGPERVLFGSDHPVNPFAFELGKVVKYAGLTATQLGGVLGHNLARLLHLEPPVEPQRLVHAASL